MIRDISLEKIVRTNVTCQVNEKQVTKYFCYTGKFGGLNSLMQCHAEVGYT